MRGARRSARLARAGLSDDGFSLHCIPAWKLVHGLRTTLHGLLAMTRRDMRYAPRSLEPDAVAALPGLVLLDFGTEWCGHCLAARSALEAWLQSHEAIDHVRIEDGRGRALGRAFRVKLWPTLVLLREGREIARVVRPRVAADLQALEQGLRAEPARP